jgi:hypothetical protein
MKSVTRLALARSALASSMMRRPGEEKIAGEEEPGLAIVIRDVGWVVAWGGNYIDDAIAEIELSDAVRPIWKAEIVADMGEVGGNHLDARLVLELRIAEAMIEMTVGVDDNERYLRLSGGLSGFREQTDYGLG